MSRDDSKLLFSTTWEIDQLVNTDEVAVSSGDNVIYTISGTPTLPVIEVQFKPTGSSKWFAEGTSSSDNTVAGVFVFYTYISGVSLRAVTSGGGTVRYFIWDDKVDY